MSGHPLVDAAVAVALALAFVAVARWSRPVPVIVASAVALALAGSSAIGVLAAASAAGLALAELVRDRWHPRLGLVSAVLLVVAYSQLQFPHGIGRTAAVAAVVLGAVWVGALWEAPRRVRRWAIAGAAATVVAVVVLVAVAVPAALRARTRLRTATIAADAASASIDSGDEAALRQHLATAAGAFADAGRALDSATVAPVALLPLSGPQVGAARTAVRAAADVAGGALRASRTLDLAGLRPVSGRFDLDRIRALERPATALAAEVSASRRRLADADSPWLLPAIDEALGEGAAELAKLQGQLETVSQAARTVPGLLGGGGARRYFLALQNPAEARGAGGILASFAELTVDKGQMSLGRVGQAKELEPRPGTELQGPADFLERYQGSHPETFWQNMTVSPDFPTDASVIEAMYPSVGGDPVDGVISLDPKAIAAVLRVLGPVAVAGFPAPVSAENVEQLLLHDQYRLFPDRPGRVDFLGTVVASLWSRLTGDAPVPGATEFGRVLAPSVQGRHLMLHSREPAEQRLFRRLRATGAVPPLGGDEFGVVVRNGLPNKMDWYLHRSTAVSLVYDDAGRADVDVAVTLDNRAPDDGVPDYVAGPPGEVPRGGHRVFLALYTRWVAESVTIDGVVGTLQSQQELGRRVHSVTADIPPGASVVVRFRLRSDPERVSRPDRVVAWAQPAVHPEVVTLHVRRVGLPDLRRRWVMDRPRTLRTGLTGD